MNTPAVAWYIVKQPSGVCEIVTTEHLATQAPDDLDLSENSEKPQRWGPFESQSEAIARRVGLIRVGKCQPV